jgi:hypothetical protein
VVYKLILARVSRELGNWVNLSIDITQITNNRSLKSQFSPLI